MARSGSLPWVVAEGVVSPLSEGPHAISAFAVDRSGNTGATVDALEVEVDLHAPDVSLSSTVVPADHVVVHGAVDDPAAMVLVTLNGVSLAATRAGNGSWAAGPFPGVSPGVYDVVVAAADQAGNAVVEVFADALEVVEVVTFEMAQGPDVSGLAPASPGGEQQAQEEQDVVMVEVGDMTQPTTIDAQVEELGSAHGSILLLDLQGSDVDGGVELVGAAEGGTTGSSPGGGASSLNVVTYAYETGASLSVTIEDLVQSDTSVVSGLAVGPLSLSGGATLAFPTDARQFDAISVERGDLLLSNFLFTSADAARILYSSGVVERSTVIAFGAERVPLQRGAIKSTLQVSDWPFRSTDASLTYYWEVQTETRATLRASRLEGMRRVFEVVDEKQLHLVIGFFTFAIAGRERVPVQVELLLNENGPGKNVVAVHFPYFEGTLTCVSLPCSC